MVLETGAPVPEVTATTHAGDRVTVEFSEPTVLYFYPHGTPGCATQARQFDAELDGYRAAGVSVYGVSANDARTHQSFADEHDLGFDLLADPDERVAAAFGVESHDGQFERTTFVCARGQVCGLYEGVRPDGHARRVLEDAVDVGLVSLDG